MTLLGRLCQPAGDAAAWEQFVRRYGPRIFAWCRQRGLQPADAEDVTQDVLLRLAQHLRSFRYDPGRSFRAWLRTVTHHAWSDHLTARQRVARGAGDDGAGDPLQSVEARDDLLSRLSREFDLELLEEATARVRLRVEPRTWDAFRLTGLDGLTCEAAAGQLGMSLAAVFKAKSRVQKLLQEEIAALEDLA